MKNVAITDSHLKKLVSKDSMRPAMQGAFYDPSRGRLYATDGHVLAVYSVEPHDDDTAGILPVEAFDARGLTAKGEVPEIRINGKIETLGQYGTKTTEKIDEVYPGADVIYDRALDEAQAAYDGAKDERWKMEIGIDLALLRRIADAIPGKDKRVRLRFTAKNKPVVVEPLDEDAKVNFLAMPLMLNT